MPSAASLACAFALTALEGVATQQAAVFHAGVDLVHVGVTVEDREGRPITDLSLEDFEIYEDGELQRVEYLAAGDLASREVAPPLHLGVLLDVSESMLEGLRMTRTAAIRLIGRLPEAEDVTLVDFDEQVRATRFRPDDFRRLVERIRRQTVSGWTALYDAMGVYLSGAAEQTGRKVMLVYTDGEDTRSALRYPELLDLLKASDVTVYAVGAVDPSVGGRHLQRRALLEEIAEMTGGLAFFPGSLDDIDAAYDRILESIRTQYTLGYQSLNPGRDGAWRTIEVRLKGREDARLRVRSRDGYFAPFEPRR